MDLPPLVVSIPDLRELLEVAGQDAHLEVAELGTQSIEDLAALPLAKGASVKLCAPGVTLSLGADASSTELSFEDEPEQTECAERILKRLNACRRRSATLTHTDGAIFAGMLLPLAAGLLVPAPYLRQACGIAAGLWMLYLWWVQGNAQRNWCVFPQGEN